MILKPRRLNEIENTKEYAKTSTTDIDYCIPFLYFKVKNHITAPGRVVTGDLRARTN